MGLDKSEFWGYILNMITIIDSNSEEQTTLISCEGCGGLGWIDLGDCEDGMTETCPECNGNGVIEERE